MFIKGREEVFPFGVLWWMCVLGHPLFYGPL